MSEIDSSPFSHGLLRRPPQRVGASSRDRLTWRMISCCRCFKRSRSIWSECNLSFCWVTCSDCDRPETPFNSHDAEPEGSTAPDVGVLCKCAAKTTQGTNVHRALDNLLLANGHRHLWYFVFIIIF